MKLNATHDYNGAAPTLPRKPCRPVQCCLSRIYIVFRLDAVTMTVLEHGQELQRRIGTIERRDHAAVAQWIEYWPPKPRVVGSIPASRTIEFF